ncbi:MULTISPECIES: acyl-CoA dehydrogenase family protein [unclassified Mycolicibacterium]|uniref:acyl-CoA dehydrogenase family protein n=3 Tax=Mycolicibacterium TaxID=1866885 RepID=UPI0012DE95D1|nr:MULTISPECIES: acyl-CoA dehydrogenase family protein [unclassified Mycolicibacterium]MUL83522.1 flavin-dependent monooxygenase [Mycolicibacterium sp. CBMA 329]MUL90513.1 flavin-dependent monooxygenase [Mycolicibacterium sp. CBMA 331]MUM00485.1 flavin-dependent monooxygenase [Mycolicibacterium sp. CBMA 334]MUM41457.1 flavin-dependent monooxygenase [Mycolicibacterium sp. CBMA 247]MUM45921.1 flavin-dependent monooxygenase [Mycolicibacterium sp. CBMA 294]
MLIESTARRVAAEPAGPARERAFDEALAVLRDRRDEFNAQGYVPADYVELLKKAGMYRASTPALFGGEPLPPTAFMKMVERISAVDPATGWVASFGSSLVYFAALPVESQREIYAAGPDIAYAGGLFPMQEAEKVAGGYLCSGTWQFASGCRGADILGIGLVGGPETQGRPLTALVSPADVEIVENWDVAGMKATGSHAIRAEKLFVPEELTFVRGGAPTVDEPLTRYPALPYAAQVLAVVTLGAARGALDFSLEVGAARTSITGGAAKGNRPTYKTGLARAEAELRSARAFFYETTDAVWDKAVRGEGITETDKAALRLGATHAAHVGRSVVLQAFDLAGTGAIYDTHPLQRYLRDALVPAQHAMLQTNTYEAAGAIMLGLDAGIPSFP